MTVFDAVSQLENAKTAREARSILGGGIPGIGEAAFDRIIVLLGTDPVRAARLAKWIALLSGEERSWGLRARGVMLRTQGKWSESASAFLQGASLLSGPKRVLFSLGAIDSLARAGQPKEAVALGERLFRNRNAEKSVRGRVALNTANAALWADAYPVARKWYAHAVSLLDSGSEFAAAAMLGLSTSMLFGGEPRQAKFHAEQAASQFRALSKPYFTALAELNLAQADKILGNSSAGVTRLLELKDTFNEDPFEQGRLLQFLAEAYAELNLSTESGHAFEEAQDLLQRVDAPLNKADCALGLGRLRAKQGRKEESLLHYRRAVRLYRRASNPVWESVSRAELASLQGKRLKSEITEQESPYLYAENLIRQRSSVSARKALRLVEKYGFVELEWQAEHILAQGGRGADKLNRYERMLKAILSSRALRQSQSARAAFFSDKAEAIGEYLELLIENDRVEDALDVVRQTRSVALLDEIARLDIAQVIADDLRELRQEIAELGDQGPGTQTRRPIGRSLRDIDGLRRKWTERSWSAVSATTDSVASADPDCLVFVEGKDRYFGIRNGSAKPVNTSRPCLEKDLRWTRFELLEALLNRSADPREVEKNLRELVSGFSLDGARSVSPDGLLWSVPWQVFPALLGEEHELLITPGPWVAPCLNPVNLLGKVGIWYSEEERLPHIQVEAEAFLNRFPHAVVCKNERDARAMLNSGIGLDLLHVACHAWHNRENPMFSALAMQGGPISGAEIAQSGFRAKAVILSACETAAMSTENRFEPDGLTRAFLACGANRVLASQWPLDDEAASVFMSDFYNNLSQELTIDTALRKSRSKVRGLMPHPYFWGGLALIGGYRKA